MTAETRDAAIAPADATILKTSLYIPLESLLTHTKPFFRPNQIETTSHKGKKAATKPRMARMIDARVVKVLKIVGVASY